MSALSQFAPRQYVRQQPKQLLYLYAIRHQPLRSVSFTKKPDPAQSQMKVPPGEKGFMRYERLYSRDSRYAPQKGHEYDTPRRFILRSASKAWELIPLHAAMVVWFTILCTVAYWNFKKIEIHLNRSDKRSPLDWERIREDYWKYPTRLHDNIRGKMNSRLPIMEVLEDEILEASKKRGARN